MRQGEIVQCQGYMGARAQKRPYVEERQGGSVEGRVAVVEEVKKEEERRKSRRRGGGQEEEEEEEEDQLALGGCSPVGISCISRLHLVGENIMPIACASATATVRTWLGLLSKHVEFIWARTAASEIAQATPFVFARYARTSRYMVRVPRSPERTGRLKIKREKIGSRKGRNRFCKKIDAISKIRTTRVSARGATAERHKLAGSSSRDNIARFIRGEIKF